jgi:hypothetical protein
MSESKPNIQLDYTVPVTFKRSPDGKVLLISGMAIDDTVNANMWQVPPEELDYFVSVSQNAQIRVDHGDRVEDIKGVVNILHSPQPSPDGRVAVSFEGEVSGDEELLAKIEREYVNSVSPRVQGEAYCSACSSRSRDDQMNLVHICRGAWEVMRNPRLIELSIVSRGAYEHAKFKPVGFAAAMDENQQDVINQALSVQKKNSCGLCAIDLTFNCLNCKSQVPLASHQAGESNQNKENQEKKKLSANQDQEKPLDSEAVKAMIDQHAKSLTEACRQSTAEAITKAVEAAKEAVKLETAAIAVKVEDTIKLALKQQHTSGKGIVGNLNEHKEPQKLEPGMVAVPPYFKELAAAAKKKRSFDAQFNQAGVE